MNKAKENPGKKP